MSDKKTSGLQVIKKEEKEPRVTAFIEAHLEKRAGAGAPAAAGEFLLVARSPESPVCTALARLAPELTRHGIEIRAVFTAIDAGAFGAEGAAGSLLAVASARIINDPRLYEAHEQLVIDEQTCWVGDCMRREPAKRDAYESYFEGSAPAARSATTAFARLWDAGVPATPHGRAAPQIGFKDAAQSGLFASGILNGETPPPTASTRH